MGEKKEAEREYEPVNSDRGGQTYVLRLYIAGSSQRSRQAIANVREICRNFQQDLYELQVIDILQQPFLAKAEQIVAVPVLIKKLPAPKRLFIGDMSDTESILAGLNS